MGAVPTWLGSRLGLRAVSAPRRYVPFPAGEAETGAVRATFSARVAETREDLDRRAEILVEAAGRFGFGL